MARKQDGHGENPPTGEQLAPHPCPKLTAFTVSRLVTIAFHLPQLRRYGIDAGLDDQVQQRLVAALAQPLGEAAPVDTGGVEEPRLGTPPSVWDEIEDDEVNPPSPEPAEPPPSP